MPTVPSTGGDDIGRNARPGVGKIARDSRKSYAPGFRRIFPTDLKGAPETDTGSLHNMLFLVVFLALIISYVFSALALRKLAGWRGHTWQPR